LPISDSTELSANAKAPLITGLFLCKNRHYPVRDGQSTVRDWLPTNRDGQFTVKLPDKCIMPTKRAGMMIGNCKARLRLKVFEAIRSFLFVEILFSLYIEPQIADSWKTE